MVMTKRLGGVICRLLGGLKKRHGSNLKRLMWQLGGRDMEPTRRNRYDGDLEEGWIQHDYDLKRLML